MPRNALGRSLHGKAQKGHGEDAATGLVFEDWEARSMQDLAVGGWSPGISGKLLDASALQASPL